MCALAHPNMGTRKVPDHMQSIVQFCPCTGLHSFRHTLDSFGCAYTSRSLLVHRCSATRHFAYRRNKKSKRVMPGARGPAGLSMPGNLPREWQGFDVNVSEGNRENRVFGESSVRLLA